MSSIRLASLALTIFACVAAPALGQEPATDAYGSDPSLPLTGFDLGLLLGGGVALILTGAVLRRLARPDA